VASTTTAKDVAGLSRTYSIDGDTLTYQLEMAFGDNELQNHLSGTLQRA
jgi:hypothetical protein